MKKLILALFALATASYAATDYTITVTNSTKVLPRRGYVATEAWAVSSNYVAGKYVLNGQNTYMALNAGTTGVAAASAPTHANGVSQPSGQSIRWIAVEAAPRKSVMIQETATTGSVWISRGFAQGVGTGTEIRATGTYSDPTVWQGEYFANGTNNTITVSDW